MSRFDRMARALRTVELAVGVVQDPYMRRIAFEHLLLAAGELDGDRAPQPRLPGYLPDAPTQILPACRG